ncbi:hypothetical protein BDN72DRAFT_958193 [Pluteus cervinus]|uniref:Uncharacterized protein n=1 Tax=Pluteus cervinus TaxID=181527 RepID=A0ACD3B129_9AGAR|nr:hypothetical protein BDN72DRAFT_958193 [Pluteus cervinus]
MPPMAGLNDLNEDVLLYIISFSSQWEKKPSTRTLSRTSKHLRNIFSPHVWLDCEWPFYRHGQLKPLPGHVLPYIKHLKVIWPLSYRSTSLLPAGEDSQLWPIIGQCQNMTALTMLGMDMQYCAPLGSACAMIPSLTSLSIQPSSAWQTEMGQLLPPTIGIVNLKEFRILLPHNSPSKWAQSSRREAGCAAAEADVISALIMPSVTSLELLEFDGEHLPYLHLHESSPFPQLRLIRLYNLEPSLSGGAVLLDYFPDAPLLKSLELGLHRLFKEPQTPLPSSIKQPSLLFPCLQQIKFYGSVISESDMLFYSSSSGVTHLEFTTTPFPMTRLHLGRSASPAFGAPGIERTEYTIPDILSWLHKRVYPNLAVLKLTVSRMEDGPLIQRFADTLVKTCPRLEELLIHTSFPHRAEAGVLLENFAAGLSRSASLKSLYLMVEWAEFMCEYGEEYWPAFLLECASTVAKRLPNLKEVVLLHVTFGCEYVWFSIDDGKIEDQKTGSLDLVQPFANTNTWRFGLSW